ncbi:MAG: hypothetical protein AB1571_00475 [Nanoarchaeota archaeon]
MDTEKIVLYVILGILIISFIWGISSFYSSRYGNNYQKALSSENPGDICATPPGYTDEQWRGHMRHHPDRYAQCLT